MLSRLRLHLSLYGHLWDLDLNRRTYDGRASPDLLGSARSEKGLGSYPEFSMNARRDGH